MMATPLFRRLSRAMTILREEGPSALGHSLIEAVRQGLGRPSRERLAYLARKAAVDERFDSANGVDTGGVEHLYSLTIEGENAAFGVNHIATDPHDFAHAIEQLDVAPEGAAFVDLGAGKARALILAAAYPFRAIVGVEFARELHRAGIDNLTKAGPQLREPARISLVLGDAAEYKLPDGPVVLYLFNPFGGPVIEAVARRATLAARNRPLRLIYMNPIHGDVWTTLGWTRLADERAYAIFAPPV
jgi:hypothetical protein